MAGPVLLFDLGGVLVENDMFGELRRLMGSDAAEAELLETWLANPVARRFELGQCDPETFARDIVQAFALPLTPAGFIEQFARWPRGFSSEVLALLASLRTRYRIGCLSNSNVVHWHDGLTAPFDFAYSSHLIGRIKPDAAAYLHVLEREGLAASDVCYFDDSASNVSAARALGLDAHQTVGAAALRSRLAQLQLMD